LTFEIGGTHSENKHRNDLSLAQRGHFFERSRIADRVREADVSRRRNGISPYASQSALSAMAGDFIVTAVATYSEQFFVPGYR
jgi:hypothetical protein